jgi:hypothetical protein
MIDVTTTQWILYCKNATQQKIPIKFSIPVLYRGYLMSLTNMCILSGLQFPLTGLVTNSITGGTIRRLTDSEQIFAAFTGGVISGVVCAPMEVCPASLYPPPDSPPNRFFLFFPVFVRS